MVGKFSVIKVLDDAYFQDFDERGQLCATRDFGKCFKCFGPADSFKKMEGIAKNIRGTVEYYDFGPASEPAATEVVGVAELYLGGEEHGGESRTFTDAETLYIVTRLEKATLCFEEENCEAIGFTLEAVGCYLQKILRCEGVYYPDSASALELGALVGKCQIHTMLKDTLYVLNTMSQWDFGLLSKERMAGSAVLLEALKVFFGCNSVAVDEAIENFVSVILDDVSTPSAGESTINAEAYWVTSIVEGLQKTEKFVREFEFVQAVGSMEETFRSYILDMLHENDVFVPQVDEVSRLVQSLQDAFPKLRYVPELNVITDAACSQGTLRERLEMYIHALRVLFEYPGWVTAQVQVAMIKLVSAVDNVG